MSISEALENYRYVVFMGSEPTQSHKETQEEYIEAYEQQLERDPSKERKLIAEYSRPLLPVYRNHVEQLAKMEQTISGQAGPISFTDDEIGLELYDEVSNIETEEEWQNFRKIFS